MREVSAEPDLIQIFVSRINKMGCNYMLTGSVAAVLYGEPRLTHDIDIVIELDPIHLSALPSIFSGDSFSVPPIEVLRLESQRAVRGHCNIIHFESGLKADLYFLGHDPLHRWAMERRRELTIDSERVWIAPPEYVILKKLQYFKEGGSEKHLRDIRLMLEHSIEMISIPLIVENAHALGVMQEWERAKNFKV